MTDCEDLSDHMPDVALGRSAWSPEEAAHLAGCPECAREWELVRATRRLGERAPVLDPDAIAVGVARRLAAERRGTRRARRVWTAVGSTAAAAAIALALAGGEDSRQPAAPVVVAEAELLVPLPELEGLEAAQLDTLLRTFDRPPAESSGGGSSTLGDEADIELEQILASWEG